MFEELKKKILKSSLFGSIIMIVIGLGLAGWFAMDAFYAITGYADFSQLSPDQLNNQLVEVNLTDNYGCYLEAWEKNTKTNQTKTTHYYYVILAGDEYSATDWCYVSVKVPASYGSKMDAMTENTYNELDSEPLYLAGQIKKLDAEETSYFQGFFRDAGFSDDEIAEMTLPYYIQCFSSKASMNFVFIAAFAVGAFLLIFGIFRIAKVAGGSSLKKLRKDIESAGYSESMIDSDFRNAKSFDKKGTLKMGRLMTYYISGSNVMIFDEITPKGHTFAVANESIAQDMLTLINTMLPWVVVGYSDELKKLYNKDRSQFLQLRYNTCEHTAVEAAAAEESAAGGQP